MHTHTETSVKELSPLGMRRRRLTMEELRCAGATVGEYVGNGLGETERTDTEDKCDEDTEAVVDDHHESEEGSSDNAHPLLFF